MKKLVIIDNDGGVDDAWAIFTVLQDPNIDVLALTCVFGNTNLKNVCQNNLRLVAQFNRTEIPVCEGANMPLVPTENGSPFPDNFQYFHGRNGFGDVELEPLPNVPTLCQENAFVKINTLASKFKGQVTLVCLGPLTNIALTMKMFPEFASNIEAAYIMGGNYTAMGNSTKRPEFNIHLDPEAADIVFRGLGNKCTLLPWETCRATKISLNWKLNLAESCGPSMKFLHKIEAPLTSRKMSMCIDNFVSSDVLLAVIFLRENSSIIGSVAHSLGVELAGKYTRGQLVVLDHLNDSDGLKVKIVTTVCPEEYKNLIESIKNL